MMRAIFGVGTADAALLAILLKSQSDPITDFLVLFGPIIIVAALATWINQKSYRQGILLLEITYSAIAAAIIRATFFNGEQDAGYQLMLVYIPIMGVCAVLVAVTAAISVRREAAAKRTD